MKIESIKQKTLVKGKLKDMTYTSCTYPKSSHFWIKKGNPIVSLVIEGYTNMYDHLVCFLLKGIDFLNIIKLSTQYYLSEYSHKF